MQYFLKSSLFRVIRRLNCDLEEQVEESIDTALKELYPDQDSEVSRMVHKEAVRRARANVLREYRDRMHLVKRIVLQLL